jgi:chromosome segregation ATPase
MNIAELRQMVERKTKIVKRLEARLEKADAELVALERQLEELEDQRATIRPPDSRTSF